MRAAPFCPGISITNRPMIENSVYDASLAGGRLRKPFSSRFRRILPLRASSSRQFPGCRLFSLYFVLSSSSRLPCALPSFQTPPLCSFPSSTPLLSRSLNAVDDLHSHLRYPPSERRRCPRGDSLRRAHRALLLRRSQQRGARRGASAFRPTRCAVVSRKCVAGSSTCSTARRHEAVAAEIGIMWVSLERRSRRPFDARRMG